MCLRPLIRHWLLLVVGVALSGALRAQDVAADIGGERPRFAFPEFKFKKGDDPRWAERDFDDRGWETTRLRDLPARDGIYWVRWRLTQREPRPLQLRDGLIFKVVASYDLYWDGRLIGRNGRVSTDAEDEGPGVVDALFQIPPELLGVGEHVVALRMSSFNTGFPGPVYALNFGWGNFRTMLLERSRTALLSVMAVGAALVAATVFGLMWLLTGRRRALLVLSALFLVVGALQALQAWRWLFDYPYNWHYPRLVTITWLTTGMAVLLPAFLLQHFELRRRWWVYGALAVFLTYAWFSSPIYNWIALVACALGFAVAFGVAVAAVVKRRRGAVVAAAGLALSLVALAVAPRDFLDHAFFLSAGPGLLGLVVAVVLQWREERREARQAALTAARLEAELLRKQLQPHFLMNTLTALLEVVERDPRTAVTLIEALAEEFRALARMSGEKLVTLGEELALCRSHLRVMSFRQGARLALATEGTRDDAQLPPAVLLTLIENGLTHQRVRRGAAGGVGQTMAEGAADGGVFRLRAEAVDGGGVRYELFSPGEPRARVSREEVDGATGAVAAVRREGTGMRYVRARLEESFGRRWTLADGPVEGGWRTVIELKAEGAA